MAKTEKIDRFLHKKTQQGFALAKKGVAVVSHAAASAKKNIEEGDSFLTEEQHQKIAKTAQKVKGFFKK
jgi:hypothetical protein